MYSVTLFFNYHCPCSCHCPSFLPCTRLCSCAISARATIHIFCIILTHALALALILVLFFVRIPALILASHFPKCFPHPCPRMFPSSCPRMFPSSLPSHDSLILALACFLHPALAIAFALVFVLAIPMSLCKNFKS